MDTSRQAVAEIASRASQTGSTAKRQRRTVEEKRRIVEDPKREDIQLNGDGLCLFAKRLERGRFVWPQATSGTVLLTRAQLSMLLEGIDWRRPERTWDPQLSV